jgi:hypothetical protein
MAPGGLAPATRSNRWKGCPMPRHRPPRTLALAAAAAAVGGAVLAATAPAQLAPPTVVTDRGNIRNGVAQYRALLGPDNGGGPAATPLGRRELNWDGVPDRLAAPRALPGTFFNAPSGPRARGAVLRTPGRHVAVSADARNPRGTLPRFGNLHPSYVGQFRTFSRERLFSPVGSNVVNLTFRVPGTRVPAVVRGFGAVYTDIDQRERTAFEYFDAAGRSLGRFAAPARDRGLSFLGVVFAEPVVARVRIAYGSGPLGRADGRGYDAAVMDDFIYGEPVALP